MSFMEKMKTRAIRNPRSLVLPEGHDPRIMRAAASIVKHGYASSVTLLGNPEDIHTAATANGCCLDGVCIEHPESSCCRSEFAAGLYWLRSHKGMSRAQAYEAVVDPLNWASMMVREGAADAMVAGADHTTASVLRSALTIIRTQPAADIASSYFVMHLPQSTWGCGGYMVFSDCAMNPDPTAAQLAAIAVAAAGSFRLLLDADPVVALLSFSTLGSAHHRALDKIIAAKKIAKEKSPSLDIDGELQLDAALLPSVSEKKAPSSSVAGRANVLIFPDLNSGNIGYKIAERLAGARAFGPFIQGLAKPVSDLSRGCTTDDIIDTAVVTLVQAQTPLFSTPQVLLPAAAAERTAS
jgi:phosphate acetyltransferase